MEPDSRSLWARLRATLFRPREPKTSVAARREPPPPFEERWGYLGLVGESQYQAALIQTARTTGRLGWAMLIPEAGNPFDSNAVAVQMNGETVGYLSRTDARRYGRRLRALATPMEVPAKLIGGELRKPSFGVLLDCREVERLLSPRPARKQSRSLSIRRATVLSALADDSTTKHVGEQKT